MKKYPFKFLDAYGKEDKAIFFGREEEVEELYRMVFQSNLVLLYGPSGTGKTSLIRCGLANRFKGSQWQALYIRRGTDMNRSLLDTVVKNTPQAAALSMGEEEEGDWFENLLEAEAAASAPEASRAAFSSDNPTAQALNKLYLATFTPVYLIFDQFEELYTLGHKSEQEQFTRTIEELARLPLPLKIIIAMREEYLARLYELEKAVPQLRHKKLRIEPMGLQKVEGVILNATANNPGSNIELQAGQEAPIARAIIEKIREGDINVQLPYLQVFMDRLYQAATGEEVERQREATFTLELVDSIGAISDVLADFIGRQSQRVFRKLLQKYPGLPADAVWQILSPFATVDGTKKPIRPAELAELANALPLPDDSRRQDCIKDAIAELESSRILRYRKEEGAYELAHDALALQVAEKRSEEEKAYLKARRIVADGFASFQDTRTYLSREQLAFIRPYEQRLQQEVDAETRAFITDSRNKRRRQQVLLWTGVAAAFAVALMVIVYVLSQQKIAEQARQDAEDAQQATANALAKSQKSEAKALEQTKLAKLAEASADSSANVARQKSAELELSFQNLRQSNARAVLLFLQKARKDASERRYLDAVSAINSAAQLQVLPDSVSQTCFRLAREAIDAVQVEGAWGLASTAYRLGIPKEEISKTCLELSDKAILNLDYETANAAVRLASEIGLAPEKCAETYLELAYFYTESGRFQAGWAKLDSAARLAGWPRPGPLAPDSRDTLNWLRKGFEQANSSRYGFLKRRYYPEMVAVHGGTFLMGCDSTIDTNCRTNEIQPEARVSDYYIARYETSWWQYYLFCQATGHDCREPRWDNSGDNPVVYVSWYDALAYANWVSRQQGWEEAIYLDADSVYQVELRSPGYRLPTEAEWEYAARGGTPKQELVFSGSNRLDSVGWYGVGRTQPVGRLKANALGLHDMSGNVWEWCWDWYGDYPSELRVDYKGSPSGDYRVLRGGSLGDYVGFSCRVAGRNDLSPESRLNDVGFRLSRAR